ncbi:hypothetical protein JCM18899A_24870 [Nocardioides sp. AN3]
MPCSHATLRPQGVSGRLLQHDKDTTMKFVRKIGVVAAACAVSFGLLGITAPAHADFTWGMGAIKK